MQFVVDELEAEHSDDITFLSVNALDGANGQQAFSQLSLPGHPSVVIFRADGGEAFRTFGIVESPLLETALADAQ